jgi:hypothetical protein
MLLFLVFPRLLQGSLSGNDNTMKQNNKFFVLGYVVFILLYLRVA